MPGVLALTGVGACQRVNSFEPTGNLSQGVAIPAALHANLPMGSSIQCEPATITTLLPFLREFTSINNLCESGQYRLAVV
jgi:hypothetical protein